MSWLLYIAMLSISCFVIIQICNWFKGIAKEAKGKRAKGKKAKWRESKRKEANAREAKTTTAKRNKARRRRAKRREAKRKEANTQEARTFVRTSKCWDETFPVGTKVTLHGLNKKDLNGRKGRIKGALNSTVRGQFDVHVQGGDETHTIRPSNLITIDGKPPTFVFQEDGVDIPLIAKLFVNSYFNEIGVMLMFSDHNGLDALIPIRDRCFMDEEPLENVVGQAYDRLTVSLENYRTQPNEIAIACYKHQKIAQRMFELGLLKLVGRKEQGYGSFLICQIQFQKMFYHDTDPQRLSIIA